MAEEKRYFLIKPDEDGGVYVDECTGEELLYMLDDGLSERMTFLSSIPDAEPQYWDTGSVLCIEGKIIVPIAKEVTTKYCLPD